MGAQYPCDMRTEPGSVPEFLGMPWDGHGASLYWQYTIPSDGVYSGTSLRVYFEDHRVSKVVTYESEGREQEIR